MSSNNPPASYGMVGVNTDPSISNRNKKRLSDEQLNTIYGMLGEPEFEYEPPKHYMNNISMESLVNMYEGKNLTIVANKLWASLLTQNGLWIMSWLAPMINSEEAGVEVYSMEMNLVPYNILPHGGVPRLITYNREKMFTSKIMYGLGFKIDMMVLQDTTEGPALLDWLVQQLGYCAIITIQMKVIAHMISRTYSKVTQNPANQEVDLNRASVLETATYCIAARGRQYFYNWLEQNARSTTGIDTVILWAGGKGWLDNTRMKDVKNLKSWLILQDGISNELVKKEIPGPTTQATTGGLNCFELVNYKLHKDGDDFNPLKTVSTTAQFHEVNIIKKARDWKVDSGDIHIWDLPDNQYHTLTLAEGYLHSGFWNFQDPVNKGTVSKYVHKCLENERSAGNLPPRGHVGKDHLYYKGKANYVLSPIDFPKLPTDGKSHKAPRQQNMMLTWDPERRTYFIAPDIFSHEEYVIPNHQIVIGAQTAAKRLAEEIPYNGVTLFEAIKNRLMEIENQEMDNDWGIAIIKHNASRILIRDGDGNYRFGGTLTPDELVQLHKLPGACLEFIPNNEGCLDLPDPLPGREGLPPAGWASAAGLRHIATHASKTDSPWKYYGEIIRPLIEACNVIAPKLESMFMQTKVLNPKYRPSHFPKYDILTMIVSVLFPVRPPVFFRVPIPTIISNNEPLDNNTQKYLAITPFVSENNEPVEAKLIKEPTQEVGIYFTNGVKVIVPSLFLSIARDNDNELYTSSISKWFTVLSLLPENTLERFISYANTIYNKYEDNQEEFIEKNNNAQIGTGVNIVNDIIHLAYCQKTQYVAYNQGLNFKGKNYSRENNLDSLIYGIIVEVLLDHAESDDFKLFKPVNDVVSDDKNVPAYEALRKRVFETLTNDKKFPTKLGTFRNTNTKLAEEEYKKMLTKSGLKLPYQNFVKQLCQYLKQAYESKVDLDLSKDKYARTIKKRNGSPEKDSIFRVLGALYGQVTDVMSPVKPGGFKFKLKDSRKQILDNTVDFDFTSNSFKWVRSPLTASPATILSIRDENEPIILPGDPLTKFTKECSDLDDAEFDMNSIEDYFINNPAKPDIHDIKKYHLAVAIDAELAPAQYISTINRGNINGGNSGMLFDADGGDDDDNDASNLTTSILNTMDKQGRQKFKVNEQSVDDTTALFDLYKTSSEQGETYFRGPWKDRLKDICKLATEPYIRLLALCYGFLPNNGDSIVNLVTAGVFPPYGVVWWRLGMSNYMYDMILTSGRGQAIVNYMSKPGVFMVTDNARRDIIFYHILQFAPHIKNPDNIIILKNVAPGGYITGVTGRVAERPEDLEEHADNRASVIATLKPSTEIFRKAMRFDNSPLYPHVARSLGEEGLLQNYSHQWSNASLYGELYAKQIKQAQIQELDAYSRVWYHRHMCLLAYRGPFIEKGVDNQLVMIEGNGPRGSSTMNCPEAREVWEGLLPEFPTSDRVNAVLTKPV
jgi:hypothetical protein